MALFSAATTLAPAPPETGWDTSWARDLDPQWTIGTKPHGGYLLALLGRAATLTAGEAAPHVCAASAHYLRAPQVGPARLDVEVLRRGRSVTQVACRLVAAGQTCVQALMTLGTLSTDAAVATSTLLAPELPPQDQCRHVANPDRSGALQFRDVVDQWLDPAVAGWADGRPGGVAYQQGWVAFPDQVESLDPLTLLVLADALPPASFDLGLQGWVPTMELTVYCRALPSPGPFAVRQQAGVLTADRMDESCQVYDASGALVAQATQLAAVRLT